MNEDDKLDLDGLVAGSSSVRTPTIRRISLVNPSSKSARSGGIVGMLNEEGTDNNFETIEATPLKVSQSRIWFYGNGQPYFCRSDNGVFPVQSTSPSYKQQANNCASCPKSKWQAGKKPPPCQMVLEVTFYDHATGEPFVIGFKGTSMTEIKKALTSMSNEDGITHYKLTLAVEERTAFNGNTYYTTIVRDIDPLDETSRLSLAPLLERFKSEGGEDLEAQAEKYQEELRARSDSSPAFNTELVEIDLE